jgi:hypothetical protein
MHILKTRKGGTNHWVKSCRDLCRGLVADHPPGRDSRTNQENAGSPGNRHRHNFTGFQVGEHQRSLAFLHETKLNWYYLFTVGLSSPNFQLCVCVFFFCETWSWYIAQAGPELNPPTLASRVLGLQACTTPNTYIYIYTYILYYICYTYIYVLGVY